MPKTIRARAANNSNDIPTANPAGHDTTFANQLKQLVTASVVYTKDVILSAVTTDYQPTTSQEDLELLNNVLDLPPPDQTAQNVDNTPPTIFNEEINYVSENIETEFLTLRADEQVGWNVDGRDGEKFDLIGNKIKFKEIPDYENPNSAVGTNIYSIRVTATDEKGLVAIKILTIIVQDRDDTLPPPPPPEPEPEPEPEPQEDLTQNIDIFNNISNVNNILDTITITSQEITQEVIERPDTQEIISEQDLKDLYNELIKGFLIKGPLHLPHANVVNGLYKRIKESIDNIEEENINLFLYRDIIDILFKTKNIFIHNMSIEKQLKVMRKKYKENLCTVNDLKQQLKALDPNGEKGLGFEGTLGIKMRKFKPAIYHQALFNLPLAWYIYLHDTTDIVPSLYYMTMQYIKQFETKEQSYDKLLQLLDEKYLDEEGELDLTSSSSNSSSSSSSDSSSDKPCGDSSTSSSSDSEPDTQPSQTQDDCSCEDKQKYDECGNPIVETDECGNPISDSSCSGETIDVSPGSNSTTSSTTTGGSAEGEGILGYFYDEKLNNAVFFISGTFTLTQTKKTRGKPKTERRRYYPKRKTRRTFGAFGNPNNKPKIKNDDGTYSFFLDGHFDIILKKRFRCVNKRKTKKHYNFCSLNQTFKNY